MPYSIRHRTQFRYEPEVRESIMEVRMQPRTDARQRCLTFSLEVSPQTNVMSYRDFLGNSVHHFDIPGRERQIRITAHAIVDVQPPSALDPRLVLDWDALDSHVAHADHWDMLLPSHYAHPTALLIELEQELQIRRRATPLDTLREINDAVYRTFAYAPNSTQVDSPIDDALQARQGVCQDFAHIMIALVRRLRIPCRYVSGYLFHSDQNDRSLEGATHAWVEAFLPDLGWIAFDPTNNLTGSQRHIGVAIGRDYADVPPTRGVYKGSAEGELSVAVTVTPVDAPQPEELPPATVIRRPRPADRAFLDQQHQQQQ
jgi:transglutaminase-like putative cysteine protease